MTFDGRIRSLASRWWKTRLSGYPRTSTVGTELPLVKRTLDRFTDDFTLGKVRSHVSTACRDDANFAALGAERDEVFS